VLFPGRLFHPSQMFANKAEAYPSEAPLWCYSKLLALPTKTPEVYFMIVGRINRDQHKCSLYNDLYGGNEYT